MPFVPAPVAMPRSMTPVPGLEDFSIRAQHPHIHKLQEETMPCLELSNGSFVFEDWQSANYNAGDLTITVDANEIRVERATNDSPLTMQGKFSYLVFGDLDFVALLEQEESILQNTWTMRIVDFFSNAFISTTPVLTVTIDKGYAPRIAISPVSGRLTFIYNPSGTNNQVQNLRIVRSDNGALVLSGPQLVSDLSGPVGAEITANKLIIHHPNDFGSNDSTEMHRPSGSLFVDPYPQGFGEAILGGANPALATIVREITLRNNGEDCLTIEDIQDSPPFAVGAASRALLPIELDPGEERLIAVEFAPSTTGDFFGTLPVSATPAMGTSSVDCVGEAREAQASISVAPSSLNFGIIEHPGSDTRSFTISNSGEKDLDVQISPLVTGSSFSWNLAGATVPLAVSNQPIQINVIFTTPGDFAAPSVSIQITPSEGTGKSVSLSGAGCVANAVMDSPPINPLDFGVVEQGYRTVRFIEIANRGDADLVFDARIVPGSGGQGQADLFGIVLPGKDLTEAPSQRQYTVRPAQRCGPPGPTETEPAIVAVSFFANDGASDAPYTAQLEISEPASGTTIPYPLTAKISPPATLDAVLVFDRSNSMSDPIGQRNKIEAARAAGDLFFQMLREVTDDRTALVSFNQLPKDEHPIDTVAGNKTALRVALGGLSPNGTTNIAGGIILGEEEFSDPVHPASPSNLRKVMIVLTDGKENRCFQRDGAGPWFSVSGRGANSSPTMFRPDGTPQNTIVLPAPPTIDVYGIGLGETEDIDGLVLDQLTTHSAGYYSGVEELSGRDYFQLEKVFTQIFMEAVDLAIISDPSYTINPGDKHTHEFDIYPGDLGAMIVIFDHHAERLPFYLRTPGGEIISGSQLPPGFGLRYRSSATARFVEIGFPDREPKRYAGRWQVVVIHDGRVCTGDINPADKVSTKNKEDEEARGRYAKVGAPGFVPQKCRETKEPVDYGIAIGAGSNLRLQPFVEPGTKYVGESLQLNAILSEAGLPVRGATVRVTIETPMNEMYTLTLRDDGDSVDGEAEDGDYGGLFTHTESAGNYRLTFRAEGLQGGLPFRREAQRSKSFYGPRKPADGGGRGSSDECCEKLLRLLEELVEQKAV